MDPDEQLSFASGEMWARIKQKDWSTTPLGARAEWSPHLHYCLRLILVSRLPMAIHWGRELVTIYNDAYGALLEERHPGALGQPLRDIWPELPLGLAQFCEADAVANRHGSAGGDSQWTFRRDGLGKQEEKVTLRFTPLPHPAASAGIVGMLSIANQRNECAQGDDLPDNIRHRLEAEINHRTRERDRIWEVSEDLFAVATFAGYLISINSAWTRLLGWSEREIKSMHVNTLRHPDDAAAAAACRAQLAAGASTARMENRLRHKDGSWRWIAWTLTVDGGLIYGAGRHVTGEKQALEALRQSERQFRMLVAGVTDYAIFMLDPNGIITNWNAGAQRIKGYTASEIVGHHFSHFYTERDRAAGLPALALRKAAREGHSETEGWRVRKDGSLFWANVVLDSIRDENGQLIGFAKITRDITERREAQAALQKAEAQQAHLQKMDALGQLTGGVAHDFNNLLTIINGHLRTIKKLGVNEPKGMRAVEGIEGAVERGASLTRQLLTFSRRQAVNPILVDLSECIEALHPMLLSAAGSTAKLQTAIPPDIWRVKIDRSEFELALLNLVINSRDAISPGGAISIVANNVRLPLPDIPQNFKGDFVALSIVDTGCGIAPDIISKVCDPFFTTKPVNQGTGLGLSRVYGFVQQSNATMTIASEVGNGTTITLYLPRFQDVSEGRQE